MTSKLNTFDKYYYYTSSVQAPELDAKFFEETYIQLRGQSPKIFREDFCGTFNLCAEWVKLNESHKAIGLDIDPEPISYGRLHTLPKLTPKEQSRIELYQENVLSPSLPKADIVGALNFSYFCFKKRSELKAYFKNVLDSLNTGGMFIIDLFGGSRCYEANEEETEYKEAKYSYFWDQDNFNPINNQAMFYIHFKRHGEKKRERVFTYDWRLWSLPELRDILDEVGFKATYVYWEGSDDQGEGNGIFERKEIGEECESFIAYIVGIT